MVDATALVNAEKKSNQEKPASADIAYNRKIIPGTIIR